MALSEEQIILKNFEQFRAQAAKLSADKRGKLMDFIDAEAQRIMLAPASTRIEYTCAYPGGLVEHSLRVLQNMAKLVRAYGVDGRISVESILTCALLHDIGKVGTIGSKPKDFYVQNDSQWHREKLGVMYNINEKFGHIPSSQMSLHLLASIGVKLDIDEWYAISTIGYDKGRPDLGTAGEPWEAVILQQAVRAACMFGSGRTAASQIA
jgi:putative nucleotidyltransferase with HDIG domain